MKINNLVFYRYYDKENEKEITKTKIFYEDGSARVTSMEEGTEEIFSIRKQENITSDEILSKVHFLTADELIENHDKFVLKKEAKVLVKVPEKNIAEEIETPEIKSTQEVIIPETISQSEAISNEEKATETLEEKSEQSESTEEESFEEFEELEEDLTDEIKLIDIDDSNEEEKSTEEESLKDVLLQKLPEENNFEEDEENLSVEEKNEKIEEIFNKEKVADALEEKFSQSNPIDEEDDDIATVLREKLKVAEAAATAAEDKISETSKEIGKEAEEFTNSNNTFSKNNIVETLKEKFEQGEKEAAAIEQQEKENIENKSADNFTEVVEEFELPRSLEADMQEIRERYLNNVKRKEKKKTRVDRFFDRVKDILKSEESTGFEELIKNSDSKVTDINKVHKVTDINDVYKVGSATSSPAKKSSIADKIVQLKENKPKKMFFERDDEIDLGMDDYDDYDDIDLGIEIGDDEETIERKKGKKTAFDRIRIRAAALGIALALGATALVSSVAGLFKHKKPTPHNNTTIVTTAENETTSTPTVPELAEGENYSTLTNLSKTKTSAQRDQMLNIGLYLTLYNGSFANKTEQNNNRAALKWDEVIALKLAYNKYSDEELKEIFNGEKLSKDNLSKDYRTAVKQLTKAFIIDDETCPVSLDKLLDNKKAENKYDKIYKAFEIAKKAKGPSKITAIEKFYDAVYEYIPTKNNNVKYKRSLLSFEPMVKAATILFNDEIKDMKVAKKVNKYYKSDELANKLDNQYSKVEKTLETAEINEKIPLYRQFREAKINDLKESNWYTIANRNIDGEIKENNKDDKIVAVNTVYKETKEYNEEQEETTKKTSSKKKTTEEKSTKQKNTSKKVNKKKTKENVKAQEKAIAEAQNRQEEIQQEEDSKAAEIVEYSSEEYNISSDYIQEDSISYDSEGADMPLPDPNKTGERFDREVTNESIANKIVEDMANSSYTTEENEYQYVYTK